VRISNGIARTGAYSVTAMAIMLTTPETIATTSQTLCHGDGSSSSDGIMPTVKEKRKGISRGPLRHSRRIRVVLWQVVRTSRDVDEAAARERDDPLDGRRAGVGPEADSGHECPCLFQAHYPAFSMVSSVVTICARVYMSQYRSRTDQGADGRADLGDDGLPPAVARLQEDRNVANLVRDFVEEDGHRRRQAHLGE